MTFVLSFCVDTHCRFSLVSCIHPIVGSLGWAVSQPVSGPPCSAFGSPQSHQDTGLLSTGPFLISCSHPIPSSGVWRQRAIEPV